MMRPFLQLDGWVFVLILLIGVSCSKKSADATSDEAPSTPQQAAAQVEQAFQESVPEVKHAATSVADAMRKGEYERAVVSLQVVKQQENMTLQQGMAVHNSMVNLEAQLIKAIENGDPKAKQAYELLRKTKRDR